MKTQTSCPFCKTLFPINTDHICFQEFIDLDNKPGKLRRAVIQMKITWKQP
jgi:hypothetical protein